MAEFNVKKWIAERKKPAPQKFGNPKLMRAGQEIDVRQWIDAGREDTELYVTLEKYGCIDRMIVDKEQVFGDMNQIMGLRDSLEQIKQADMLWESLPLEFRRQFLNDKQIFMREGLQTLEKQIKAEAIKDITIEKPIAEKTVETKEAQ